MAIDAIMLNSADTVATAVQILKAGQKADVRLGHDIRQILIGEDIPYGHKFAVHSIPKGQDIIKYGEVIGRATQEIREGHHAHVQNIESLRGRGDLQGEA